MKLLNIFKKIIKWSLIGIAVIILIILGINVFDEKAYKEIEEYGRINEADVKDKENGYYTYLMFYAPVGDDPHLRGIEVVKKINISLSGNSVRIDDKELYEYSLEFIGEYGKISKISLSIYDANIKETQKIIDDNRAMLERYRSLYNYPRFKETVLLSSASPHLPSIDNAHALQLANIIMIYRNGMTGEALSLLVQDVLFWRSVMENAGRDLTKIISTIKVRRDIELFSEIIGELPTDKDVIKIADKILAPLTTDERSYDVVRRREFVANRNFMKWITVNWDVVMKSEVGSNNKFLNYLLRPFFKPNATLNAIYKYYIALGEIENLSGREFTLRIKERPIHPNPLKLWDFIYGHIGKSLFVHMYEPITHTVPGIVHNLDGLMKLVSLKLKLKENAVKENDVESFIKESGADYTNPYTGEPMKWDAKKKTIYFNGMEEDGQLNKLIEITL